MFYQLSLYLKYYSIGDGISKDTIQYNPFPSRSGSFKIDDKNGIGIENEVLKQIRNEWFSSRYYSNWFWFSYKLIKRKIVDKYDL